MESQEISNDTVTTKIKYSEPLVIPPAAEHRQTFIILHGRGSTALKFADPLLSYPVTPNVTDNDSSTREAQKTFQSHFPNVKFIFPTAPLRRAVIYNRSLTHQWFDNWSLDRPEHREGLQIRGLRETSEYIHSLLQRAIEEVGAQNVVLIGMSQGCAASLTGLLTWQGEPIRAFVGMCGWLPFRKAMLDVVNADAAEDLDDTKDLFERSESDETEDGPSSTKLSKIVEWLREELEMEEAPHSNGVPLQNMPVLLCHGDDDEKVPCELGRLASSLLKDIGINTRWLEYEKLTHWYSEAMLLDVVDFLVSL